MKKFFKKLLEIGLEVFDWCVLLFYTLIVLGGIGMAIGVI